MPKTNKLTLGTIPYYLGVEGFAGGVLGVPNVGELNDEDSSTSHVFDAVNDQERCSFPAGGGNIVSSVPWRIHHIRHEATVRASGLGAAMTYRVGPSGVTGSGTGVDLFPGSTLPNGLVQRLKSERFFTDWNDLPWTTSNYKALHYWFQLTAIDDPPDPEDNPDAPPVAPGYVQIFDTYCYVVWMVEPRVTFRYPANGTQGVALAPKIKWTFVGEGDPQHQYQIKVWDRDIFTAPGFDPETAPNVYDTDWLTSSATQHQVTTPILQSGEYYVVGIRTSKNWNVLGMTDAEPYVGSWAYSTIRANKPPSVSQVQPIYEVDSTRRPTIVWTFSDAEGQKPLHHYVKVWTTDEVQNDPDWDADESPGIRMYDSETPLKAGGLSNGYKWKLDPALPNGYYTVGVRATQQGDGVSSVWDLHEIWINTNFPKPNAPFFTATPETENARVKFTIQRNSEGMQPSFWSIARSLDPDWDYTNTEWVRDFDWLVQKPYSGNEIIEYYDYEAPSGKIVNYNGYMWSTTPDDPEPSPPTLRSIILKLDRTWLKDPLNPELNMSFPVEESWLDASHTKTRSIRRPLGRKLPVVLRGKSEGESFTVTFIIVGIERKAALDALLDSERTLMYQTPRSSWYVELMGYNEIEHLRSEAVDPPEEPVWRVAVQFQEVAAP